MLKKFKQATLGTLKTSGVFRLVESSRWRQRRLLILAYHGISQLDEHRWDYTQFMTPELFRERLRIIKESGCAVLPLGEAVERLYSNDLPDKCVSITFDDGTADFYSRAFPLLKEFGFPVTLYLTTFYSHYNRPVFDVACSYVLWKGCGATLDLKPVTGEDAKVWLSSAEARSQALRKIQAHARESKLSAEEKDALAARVAGQLGVDYDEILKKRILHLLTPDEVKSLAVEGVDVELHTHRHRTPRDRELFMRELEDNRRSIREMTGKDATHFCYPSGSYDPVFLPWLREAGVRSATTCELGLASKDSDPLLLPRLLDISTLSRVEFASWLSGVSAALPQRRGAGKVAAY
ncbi:MAG TPA: polysaccharide deacetylase family protein [Pyrinomonadaceae bacterium]|nr:polysaccharide deacetylase family protein [Pyrinomonadaceae bacterium]